MTDLGEREQALSNGDRVLQLLHRHNAVLHRLGVLGPSGLEDSLDFVNLALRPVAVWLAHALQPSDKSTFFSRTASKTHASNEGRNKKEADGNDGLLVHDVKLL